MIYIYLCKHLRASPPRPSVYHGIIRRKQARAVVNTMWARRWLSSATLTVAISLWHPLLAFQLGRGTGVGGRTHAFLTPGSTGVRFGGDVRWAPSRAGRRRIGRSPAHPGMSATGPTPTNGLTTGSVMVDKAGGVLSHLDSDLFVLSAPPSLVSCYYVLVVLSCVSE